MLLRAKCYVAVKRSFASFSFPVIFISFRPKSLHLSSSYFSFRSTHMHCTSYLACHAMSCIMLFAHCTVIDFGFIACVLALGRAGRRVRERGICRVRERGASF